MATDFRLLSTSGDFYSLGDCMPSQAKGLVVAFICNHCPYVQAIIHRLVSEAKALRQLGIGMVAINSNDAIAYPEDNFTGMVNLAQSAGFDFPYLHDETQYVAKRYGAVCTPDFFGFAGQRADKLSLQYRGRLDNGGKTGLPSNGQALTRDLYHAMQQIAITGRFTEPQFPSIGCSIKWKNSVTNQAH